jgi:hypothetical protein
VPGLTFRYHARSPRQSLTVAVVLGCAPHMWAVGWAGLEGLTASLAGRGTSRPRRGRKGRPHREPTTEVPVTSQQADARPDDVKGALTVNRTASLTRSGRPTCPSPRRRSKVENDDFARFAVRIIRAHGRRVADGDVEGLRDLLALDEELDAATQAAVDGLRGHGFSWGEIASRLGTSRQAVQQRWGR